MKEQTSLALQEQPTQITPFTLLQAALQTGNLDMVREFMQLKREFEADEARKAFTAAFAAFKAESIVIVKNIAVTAGPLSGKKYADLFSVVNAITPALSKHGLSLSWKLTKDEPNWLEVTCTLEHDKGHSKSVSMGGPPDAGGAKNAIQARASAKTYLERYTALAITGMAASDQDNDGNGSSHMDERDAANFKDAIDQARNLNELRAAFSKAWEAAKEMKDAKAQDDFKRMYEARKKGMQ